MQNFFSLAQNVLSAPEVGSDGVVYETQNLGTLHAFNAKCTASGLQQQTTFNHVVQTPGLGQFNRRGKHAARFEFGIGVG